MSTLGYPVIDADGHVEEAGVDWVKRVGEEWGDWAPRYISDGQFESGQRRFAIEGKIFPRWEDKWGRASRPITVHKPAHQWTGRPGMMDPKERLKDMDLEGIDIAVLFGGALSAAAIGLVENPALALATCRAYNDWLAEYCSAAPERLKGVAVVPFQDPEAGARELSRAVRELGLIAVRVPTWPDGRDPGGVRFDPIYAAAQELGVPACVHLLSARTVGADRFDNFFLKHVFYGADVFMADIEDSLSPSWANVLCASLSACAVCTQVLVGMQPTVMQVPPIRPCSISTTFAPSWAARIAAG